MWHPGMECPYECLSNTIKEAARAVAPSNGRKKRPPWFKMSEDKILKAIRTRDEVHRKHQENTTEESKQTLCLSRCELSAVKATGKVTWLELKLNEIEAINDDPHSTS
jgi:hypothetical protein